MKKKQKNISIPKSPNFDLYLNRNSDVSWTELGGLMALVSIQSGSFYTLNETGSLVWFLANKKNLSEIGEELAIEYGLSQEVAEQDVWGLACELVKEDLAEFSHKAQSKTK